MFEASTTNISTGYSGTSITTNGTVGMGCSNPSERLTVLGTTITPGLTLQGNSTINYSK